MDETHQRPPCRIAIIGAGLGGLVLAHALVRAGDDAPAHRRLAVTIYERDETSVSREQGYTIGLNEMGLTALDRVMFPALRAMIDDVSSDQDRLDKFTITDHGLNVLAVLRSGASQRSAVVNRWKLREILAMHGPALPIKWNKRLVRYEENSAGDGVVLHFEDGSQAEADVVVGADGAKSHVRAQRCPQLMLQDADVVNISGVVPFPNATQAPHAHRLLDNSLLRALGTNGSTILMIPWVSPTHEMKLIWVLTQNAQDDGAREAASSTSSPQTVLGYVRRQIEAGQYQPELETLIGITGEDSIIRGGHLYTISWPPSHNPLDKTSRVTLLGDAAHAMTTHMGMGANTALADAIDLADALLANNWQTRLANYEKKMMHRGLTAAKMSLYMTRMITVRSWWAQILRAFLFRVMGLFSACFQR